MVAILEAAAAPQPLDENFSRVIDVKRKRQENVEYMPKKHQVDKYQRHRQAKTENEKNLKRRRKLELQERLNNEAVKRLAASELLLTETSGYLEADGNEKTYKFRQADIVAQLDIESASKVVNLELSYGPYNVDYTRNGRFFLIGGQKGSLSVIDCLTLQSKTEINVREKVRDVCFFHNETMWAAAQKKYVYIYDTNGIEVHCLREHMMTYQMEFLPYHFLLSTIGEFGELRYLDVSTGLVCASHKTKKGPCHTMCQNQRNGVIHLGHNGGSVSLWTPNVGKPVVEFLAQKGRVVALNSISEYYLASAGLDGLWKVWDMRKYEAIHSFNYFGSPPSTIASSQTGLVGIGFGPHLQIWKDICGGVKPKMPYMTHELNGNAIEQVLFRPYEDFCAIGSKKGIHTIAVPGSCLANYDSYAADPYENKKQRQEREVHSLLEKLPATTITLNPEKIGMLDDAPRNVVISEELKSKMNIIEAKENNTRRNKKAGSAAKAAVDRKKYAELTKKLAQKRLLEQKLEERGETPESATLKEEGDVEEEAEKADVDDELSQRKSKEKVRDALDRCAINRHGINDCVLLMTE